MRFLVLDVSNIAYRAWGSYFNRLDRHSAIISSIVQQITRLMSKFAPDYIIAAFDDGREFRDALVEEYKHKRVTLTSVKKKIKDKVTLSESDIKTVEFKDAVATQLRLFEELCKFTKITPIRIKGVEADDLIAAVSFSLGGKTANADVVIVSGDRDMIQLITNKVHLYQPISAVYITDEDIEQYYLFPTAEEYLYSKFIIGDPSDNIDGIFGIGEKTAFKLYNKIGSLNPDTLEEKLLTITEDKVAQKILPKIEVIKLNRKLMDLSYANEQFLKEDAYFNARIIWGLKEFPTKSKYPFDSSELDEFIDKYSLYSLAESELYKLQ